MPRQKCMKRKLPAPEAEPDEKSVPVNALKPTSNQKFFNLANDGDKEEAPAVVKAEQESEESLDAIINGILDEKDDSPSGVKTRRMANGCRRQAEKLKAAEEAVPKDFEDVGVNGVKKPSNPLTVSLIVSEVMKYLKSPELKKCRLVSKTWNACAVPIFKLDHPPVVFTKPTQIFNFNRLMLKAHDVPYTSFKLRSRFTSRLEKYFQTFGHEIKKIEITSKPGKDWVDFKNIFTILQWMQNLRSLTLVNIDFPKPVDGAASYATTLAPVPVVLNNIETLQFSGWFLTRMLPVMGPLDMPAQQCIFDIYNAAPMTKNLELNILRATIIQNFLVGIGQLRRLEKLSIQSLNESDLGHLVRQSPNLPNLKSLTMREIHLNAHGQILLQVMDIYTESLEYLDVRALTTRGIKVVKFPLMKSLKELRMDTFYVTDLFEIDPLDLRLKPEEDPFPVLTKIVLSQNVLNGLSLARFRSSTVVEVSLKMSLTPVSGFRNAVQDDNEPIENPLYDARQAQLVAQLPEMFPNMKKLKVEEIRCSALRILFRTSIQLEELEISHPSTRYGISMVVYLNQVLTGLEHPNWLSRMFSNYVTLHPDRKNGVLDFIQAISPDSIRNLRKLKVLVFSGRQCIDDSTVNLALLHMNPLEKLVIHAGSVCFGDTTLAALRRRHKMVQIVASTSVPPIQHAPGF